MFWDITCAHLFPCAQMLLALGSHKEQSRLGSTIMFQSVRQIHCTAYQFHAFCIVSLSHGLPGLAKDILRSRKHVLLGATYRLDISTARGIDRCGFKFAKAVLLNWTVSIFQSQTLPIFQHGRINYLLNIFLASDLYLEQDIQSFLNLEREFTSNWSGSGSAYCRR